MRKGLGQLSQPILTATKKAWMIRYGRTIYSSAAATIQSPFFEILQGA